MSPILSGFFKMEDAMGNSGRQTSNTSEATPPKPEKALAIFFGFPGDKEDDRVMEAEGADVLADITNYLLEHGVAVVTKSKATSDDFFNWVAGDRDGLAGGASPAGILWTAHGSPDGSLQTADSKGGMIGPESMTGRAVAPSLRLAIFSSCYTGFHASRWYEALNEATIVGWDGLAMHRSVMEFYGDSGAENGADLGATLKRILRTYLLNPALD